MREVALFAFVIACLSGCKSSVTTGTKEKEETDIDLIQGLWVADAYEREGKPVGEALLRRTSVDIEGNTLELVENRDNGELSTFTLNEDANPKQIDLRLAARPEKVLLGIYRIDGDFLRICWADFGKPRPTAFTTINDMGVVSLALRRLHGPD